MKNVIYSFFKKSTVIIFLFLGISSLYAANRNTIATGNWSSLSTWNDVDPDAVPTRDDNVVINHTVNLNANWGPQNSGSITINATSSGSGTLNMSGGNLIINANVTLTGTGINLNGGTITIKTGKTLTMPGFNEASTHIIVETGAFLIINGNLLNNRGNVQVDGLITINGNYDGQASNAIVTGTGNITSTGSMIGINNSSIFGTQNPNCPSNCDGRNLSGGGNCTGPRTAIPDKTTLCLGEIVSFTSTLTGGYTNNQPLAYQWQIDNGSGFFINIQGANSSTYSEAPLVTSTYRIAIGDKQNPGDPYCYKYSSGVTITVNSCPNIWTGATSTAWNVATNWSLGLVPTSVMFVSIPASVASGRMPIISATSSAGSLSNAGTITFTGSGILNVAGNITNTGTVTTVSGSTLALIGTTPQTVSGLTSVYNLSINNTNGSGVSLSSALLVNGTLSLVNGVLTTNSNLTINFDAGGNIAYSALDAGSISGNVIGTRNLVAKTHYVSSPFVGVTSGQINNSTPIYRPGVGWLLSYKKFDTQGWSLVQDLTTTLNPTAGYSLAMFDPASLTMTGTYTHGASYSSGNYDNVVTPGITKGMYFMVGNPYPSTLDWSNASGWTKSGIDNAIYFWNPVNSSISSYVGNVGTNGATQYIPAMQAFLVKATGTGGFASVAVNSNARVLTNASYFRTSANQLARLVVKNASGSSFDETVVRMDDEFTSDFDSEADACKIGGAISLYTKTTAGDVDYSINTLPITGPEMLVPLNLKVAVSGLYTIECSEYSIPGYSMILEDKQTQTYTLMDNSTVYTINANKTDSTNRFVLRFVAGLTTGVVSGSSSALKISTYDNQMMLNTVGIQTSNAKIDIYDASGLHAMHLENQSIAPGIQTLSLPGLLSGVYIVKIDVAGTTYVGKVVLK